MILRYIADIIIVVGCGYVGMIFASRMDARIKQLNDFEAMLRQLSFNIGFLSLPVREAILRAAETQSGAVRKILDNITALMAGRPDISLAEAWSIAVTNYKSSLCLKSSEIEILKEFSNNIGRGDIKETLDSIQLTVAKLKLVADSAVAMRARDGKLYRGMGFLAGMLIVILLF